MSGYLAAALVVIGALRPTHAETTTVAVLYFDNNSLLEPEKYDALRKGLCDMMITELSAIAALAVVERAELERVLGEIALGQSGVVDEQSAPKVGKMLGARTLLLGSFMKGMGDEIRIDARLVEVESGRVLKAEEVSGRTGKLFRLIQKLVFEFTEQLEVTVHRDERKKIESTNRVGLEALRAYSEGLEALDAGDTDRARRHFTEALELDESFERARTQLQRLEEEP
jgi:TolB-like protein